jgi:hypothetical protein
MLYNIHKLSFLSTSQAWDLNRDKRPSFGEVQITLERIQSDINNGLLDSPTASV